MTEKAKRKELEIAAVYPRIGDAAKRCPYGGHCASCAYRIQSVKTGPGLRDRMFLQHDYCRAKY